jgi:hypothetical protein
MQQKVLAKTGAIHILLDMLRCNMDRAGRGSGQTSIHLTSEKLKWL